MKFRYILTESKEDIEPISYNSSQEFTSQSTAKGNATANHGQGRVPALFHRINIPNNSVVFDYGCGMEPTPTRIKEFLEPRDITYIGFDKYNQSSKDQASAIDTVKQAGGADIATCANVLNVIKERNIRVNEVIKNIYKLLKPNGVAYFDVYEDKSKAGPKQTGADRWQEFRAINTYVEEVAEVFGDANVTLRSGIIKAVK